MYRKGGPKNTLNFKEIEKKKMIRSFRSHFQCGNELCELSMYRENSQQICEKLLEQIIHILDMIHKISQIE